MVACGLVRGIHKPAKYICFLGYCCRGSVGEICRDKWVLHGRNWQVHGEQSSIYACLLLFANSGKIPSRVPVVKVPGI